MPDSTALRDFDAHMMAVALRLAERGLGRTAPNPAVGAVIADETTGEVIARGWTAPGGRPHAEPEAIARAKDRARGATMYVTLEPCSHHGKTPPCADAIVAAGLRRVVCAIEDPDARVAGRGLARLREAGIEVQRGLLAEAAHWVTVGHILRVTERRPLVVTKLALGADGAVPRGAQGQPVWATSPEARAAGHMMRARADAILVGRGTVIADDPMLDCRLPGLEDRSPTRVVLARRLEGLHASRLALTASERGLWVFCADDSDAAKLEALGARIFRVPVIGGALWLPSVMEALVAEGITRLLVEGGPATWRGFSDAGLIDEAVLFHARARGGAALPELHAKETLQRYVATTNLQLYDHRTVGSDDMMVFRRHWHSLKAPAESAKKD